jgi:hypothetical protein
MFPSKGLVQYHLRKRVDHTLTRELINKPHPLTQVVPSSTPANQASAVAPIISLRRSLTGIDQIFRQPAR